METTPGYTDENILMLKKKHKKDKKKKEKKPKIVNGVVVSDEDAEHQINGGSSHEMLSNGDAMCNGEIKHQINSDDIKQEPKKKSKKRKIIDEKITSKKQKITIKEEKETPSQEEIEGAFENFPFSPQTLRGLKEKGIKYLFPVQAKTYAVIAEGCDVIVQARTGTGKTLSFVLPIVEKLQNIPKKSGRAPTVLVMAPTRELAKQISENYEAISPSLSTFCIYGGTSYWPQETAIRHGLDVLVGTPGRLLDYVYKKKLDLSKLKHVVLDEVDRMLDMGFAETVEEILQAAYSPDADTKPQTLLFSATVPPWVRSTGKKYMADDVKHINMVGNERNKTSKHVDHLAIMSSYHQRAAIISDVVRVHSGIAGRSIIFTETKKDANELSMNTVLKVEAQVLHGDIPQQQRELTLKGFRDGRFPCLIATDVAARGLDIPEVDLVIQCCPPKDVDDYIHRSGRTGRAHRTGVCVCFYKPQESWDLTKVEQRAGIKFKRVGPPTPKEILKANASEAVTALAKVPDKAVKVFKEMAVELIEEKGAESVVAAALAYISGAAELTGRSLITNQEGSTTYLIKTSFPLGRKGDVIQKALCDGLPDEVKEAASSVKLGSDNHCAVFDIPSEMDTIVKEQWQDTDSVQLEEADELPKLQEPIFAQSRGGGNRGGGGYRGGQGSGFSRGGGRGGRGGGFRGRGGRGGGFRGGRGGGAGRGGGGGRGRFGGRGGRGKVFRGGFTGGSMSSGCGTRTTFD